MRDRLLLLQGTGGTKMARYRHYMNPVTRTRVKRRRRRGFLGDMGADVAVMQRGLTASFDAVKAVGVTALIAAGGAIATDFVFKQIGPTLKLTAGSTEENLAKAVLGIAGGLVIGKFLKKPQLGAAFAIGAVVLAVYDIAKKSLKMSGLGYIQSERVGFHPGPLALGAQRIESPGFHPMPAPRATAYGWAS